MTDLQIGATAPDFNFPPDTGGEGKRFSSQRGPLVVFFYPRIGSPACTDEVMDFSKHLHDFDRLGVAVVGVSPDSPVKLARFRDKHGVRVTLADDVDLKLANDWGVWVEKSMYGRKFMGVERATFLVDAEGNIAAAWRKVKVNGHAEEVLDAAAKLTGRKTKE